GLAQVGADVLLGGEGLAALVGGDLVLALGVEGAGERLALRLAGAAGLRGAHLRLELPVRGLRGEAGELPRAGVHLPQEVPVRGEGSADRVVVVAEDAVPGDVQAWARVGGHGTGEQLGQLREPGLGVAVPDLAAGMPVGGSAAR